MATSSVVRSSLSCFPQCISVSCQRRTKRSTADLFSIGFGDFEGFGGTPLPKRPLSAPPGRCPFNKGNKCRDKNVNIHGPKFLSPEWRCPLNKGVPKERFQWNLWVCTEASCVMFLAQRPPAMGERRLSLYAGLRTFLHAERTTYPVEQASMCAYPQFSKIKRAPSLFFLINMKQGMPATTNFSHRVVYQILFAHGTPMRDCNNCTCKVIFNIYRPLLFCWMNNPIFILWASNLM